MILALGAAGLLALIVLLQRRGSAGADQAAQAGTLATPGASTFADNGEQAAQLGTTVTEGVGTLQQTADDLALSQQGFLDQFAGLVDTLQHPTEPAAAVQSAPAALAMTPSNANFARAGGTKHPSFSVVNVDTAKGGTGGGKPRLADSRTPTYHQPVHRSPTISKKHPHRGHGGGGG